MIVTHGEQNHDVDHLPGHEEEDSQEDGGEGDKVVGLIIIIIIIIIVIIIIIRTDLVVEKVADHLVGHLLRVVQLRHLKPDMECWKLFTNF